jgi:transposase
MRTVQQNVFLILNRVPVTCVTNPELIRPSSDPVMTHSLDQNVMARKAKARKCTAEIVGNIQAKVERQHKLVMSFSVNCQFLSTDNVKGVSF